MDKAKFASMHVQHYSTHFVRIASANRSDNNIKCASSTATEGAGIGDAEPQPPGSNASLQLHAPARQIVRGLRGCLSKFETSQDAPFSNLGVLYTPRIRQNERKPTVMPTADITTTIASLASVYY